MEKETIFIIWLTVGFIGWVVIQYLIDGEMTLRSILTSLILSFMGGFAFVISIILYIGLYLKGRGIKLNDILDKRIM